ncbi:hypothetical protein [Methanospirillum lacunae]|uniref:hypothetical protein n=1 Tax=Methanospirillum lacunae TaxID=668570 RepID=UPI0038FC8060
MSGKNPLFIISSFRDLFLKCELFDLRAGEREIRVYRDMRSCGWIRALYSDLPALS